MQGKILFLDTILVERLWGGSDLPMTYHTQCQNPIGEAWIVSGHKNGQNRIQNGLYKGRFLNDLYLEHRELFSHSEHTRFPLLVKILDAHQSLSVQVHPNDNYALKKHGDLGKTECWYVLDAKEDAEIVDGIRVNHKEKFKNMVEMQQWNNLFITRKVKKDDFIFIPAGHVHAIGPGLRILEIQQSSDTTYRIYDYDRIDINGKKRDLHIQDAFEVIDFKTKENLNQPEVYHIESSTIKRLVACDKFTVDSLMIDQKTTIMNNREYSIVYVIEGKAIIEVDESRFEVKKNDVFIVTSKTHKLTIYGKISLINIKENIVKINQLYK